MDEIKKKFPSPPKQIVKVTNVPSKNSYKFPIKKNPMFYFKISDRFVQGKFLGRGKFSDVYFGQDKMTKMIVALKIISFQTIQTHNIEESLSQEIHLQ